MIVRRLRDDELYHHGIKGQKWGVRRYQNPDGSLTTAGKDRYNSGDDSDRDVYVKWKITDETGKVTYSNRIKHTTGKSKGVKRRGKVQGQTTNFNSSKSNKFQFGGLDSHMRKNTVKLKTTSMASGDYISRLYFPDKKAYETFTAVIMYMQNAENKGYSLSDRSVEETLQALFEKYDGELVMDPDNFDPSNPWTLFSNIDELEKVGAGVQRKYTEHKQANVKKENRGRNGMPSYVAELARKTDAEKKQETRSKVNSHLNKNGAPSNVKKYIYMKNTTKRPTINAQPGANGMPSNLNPILYKKK